jgi:nitrite reductase/ring-hydroxylating ferredoxin subunit
VALRVKVCKLADVVDGEMRAFQVKGVTWPVIVTRVDDELMACPGVCPHEDVALWNGDLTGSVITCPGHAYEFDMRTGLCKHDRELELRRYKITIVGDEIWVDLL